MPSLVPHPPRLIRWAVLLAIFFLGAMTLLRFGMYLALGPVAGPVEGHGPAFVLGLRYDLRVVCAALLPLLVLGAVPWLDPFRHRFGRRLWLVLLVVFCAALAVMYVSDFLHVRYLNQRLNASALGLLEDTRIALGMAWESYPVLRILAAIGVVLALCVWVIRRLHRAAAAQPQPARRWVRGTWYVATVFAGMVGVFGRLGQFPLRWSDAFGLRNEVSANLALNPIESFTSSLNFRTAGFDRPRVTEHYARMAAYLGVKHPEPERLNFERSVAPRADTPARRPNIVLVLCESFSGYKSSMWGNPLDPTPFFAGLTKQGVFFDHCFTPHIGTARGVWALLTGIPDVSPRETASRNPAMVDQHTILDDFDGYEKLYFLGGSSSWANIRGLLTNNIAGLKLYEEDSYDAPRLDVWGISDKNLFIEADKVLRTQTRPFFAIIQTADNHRPYTIPKEDLGEFQRIDVPLETLRQHGFESAAEFNAFRYTDFAFRKFFAAAESAPYFEDTLFVFIGDHGIGGNAGTMFPPAWTGNHLTRYHVPLLFYAPKRLAARRIQSVASMVDVMPTIAGLANVAYRNTTLGRDLFERDRIDAGAGNVAFIMDHNDRTIGIVKQAHYGVQIPGGRHELVPIRAVATDGRAEPLEEPASFRVDAEAFHETARYLLLHNRKPAGRRHAGSVLTRATLSPGPLHPRN